MLLVNPLCLSVCPQLPVNWLTDSAIVVSMECISLSLSCHGGYSRLLQPKVYKIIQKQISPQPFFKDDNFPQNTVKISPFPPFFRLFLLREAAKKVLFLVARPLRGGG